MNQPSVHQFDDGHHSSIKKFGSNQVGKTRIFGSLVLFIATVLLPVLLVVPPSSKHTNLRSLKEWEEPSTNFTGSITSLNESNNGCPEEAGSWVSAVPPAVLYIIIIVLVLFSAFFSGLTLALMGLDTTGLEIVMSGDDPKLSQAAGKIYPVRKNGNLLLCTLLLGNVAVNTLLGILMADITSGTVGFITSTALIVIFGEIIPQATFSRYALQVGEYAVPVMRVIIAIFYVLAKPMAFCLDKVLGHELTTVYSKAEMSKLLEIHMKEGQLNNEEAKAMKGALQYQEMTVEEVYTPLDKTFMVNVDDRLNFETMSTIFKTGYSRIPVYENDVHNIVGLLFVKDLIFINPIDETPIRNFVDIFGRGANVVWLDDKLGKVLAELKKGHCHMALVRDVDEGDGSKDPTYTVTGIITLEDIIEIILGDQIVDETDRWEDVGQTTPVTKKADFDWAKLRLLDANIVDKTLDEGEVRAVAAHLCSNYSTIFNKVSEKSLLKMIAATPVLELKEDKKEVNEFLPSNLMYERDQPSDKCTLILGGKVSVVAGKDNFRSDLTSWNLLAPGALSDELYAPDFSAYVSKGPCRCLQMSREMFKAAMVATELEKVAQDESEHANEAEEAKEEITPSSTQDFAVQRNYAPTVRSASTIEAPSTSNVSDVSQSVKLVEHRGKLLSKFLKEHSVHGNLLNESDDEEDNK